MQDEQDLNSEERILMESLSGLVPEGPGVSEQTLWYEAGVRAGRRRAARWRAVAAAVIVLAGGVVMWRPKAATIYVKEEVPRQAPGGGVVGSELAVRSVATTIDYVSLRDAVEQHGMDALPVPQEGGVLSQPAQGVWPQPNGSVPSPWDSLNSKGSL